jgi:hypothetical protein
VNRPELIEPTRFGNHVIAGLGGVLNLLRDYTDQGGTLTDGDHSQLVRHLDMLTQLVDYHTTNTPGGSGERQR